HLAHVVLALLRDLVVLIGPEALELVLLARAVRDLTVEPHALAAAALVDRDARETALCDRDPILVEQHERASVRRHGLRVLHAELHDRTERRAVALEHE